MFIFDLAISAIIKDLQNGIPQQAKIVSFVVNVLLSKECSVKAGDECIFILTRLCRQNPEQFNNLPEERRLIYKLVEFLESEVLGEKRNKASLQLLAEFCRHPVIGVHIRQEIIANPFYARAFLYFCPAEE